MKALESKPAGDRQTVQRGRNDAFDIAKGIGFLLVALGHVDPASALSGVIYYFHMPLFFFISGWFLSADRDGRSMRAFIGKKARRLLLPFGFMALVSVVLDTARGYLKYGELGFRYVLRHIFDALYASGSVDNKNLWGVTSVGLIWFLPALFLSLMIVWPLIRSKLPVVLQGCTLAALFALCRRSAELVWLPFSVQAAGCAAVFVWAGFTAKRLYREAERRELVAKHRLYCVPALISVPLLILEYVLGCSVVAASARYSLPVLSVGTAILASCAVLWLSSALRRRWRCRFLTFLGRNSLIAYCAHQVGAYCFAGLQYYFPVNTDKGWQAVLWYAAYMLVQIVFALVAIAAVRKAKALFRAG